MLNTVKENVKLDMAYINYQKIIKKRLPYKFSYLDEWVLKKSKLLLNEAEQFESNVNGKYRTYKRGTIVKADFGVNLGSEMSQIHFAIVLNNYDNTNNNILTVIPLTSKPGKYNLSLDNLIEEVCIKKIKEISNSQNINSILKAKLSTLIEYYKSNQKNTYACCSLITTISKTRIFKPINEYDVIGKERCSNAILDKIDKEIIDKFTKKI